MVKKEGGGELQTVAVLPPALRCLVFLWEELTTSCMQVRFNCTFLTTRGPKIMLKLLKYSLILAKVFIAKLFLSCYSLLIHLNKAYIYIHHTFLCFLATTLDVPRPTQHRDCGWHPCPHFPTLIGHLARVCVLLLLY